MANRLNAGGRFAIGIGGPISPAPVPARERTAIAFGCGRDRTASCRSLRHSTRSQDGRLAAFALRPSIKFQPSRRRGDRRARPFSPFFPLFRRAAR
ncbi:hypothetical protein [Burkholderia pseudomallei]|uniref:hypothetical protein n=1 Tax=Burkholderia pseudomallei TaxID=28450 RepID=UPI0009754DC6|nr:hypothetical protein [Burkholderia pseudomallei]